RVAFYNSGTEAVMVALRLARAATSKSKIVVFAGSYHGSFDGVLAQRDPFSVDHKGMPLAGGIPEKMIDDLYILPYGDLSSLEFIRDHAHELAGVLVEPVQSRKPSLQPAYFLRQLDSICKSNDVPFIVDEIITGFRIHPGGAQAWFGIKGDLVLYGKVIGGGMPLGIVAGSERFMTGIDGGFYDFKDNSHPVLDHRRTFVAGTFCHHPVTLAASNAALDHLIKNGYNLQANLNKRTTKLALDLNDFFKKHRIPIYMEQFGSLFHFTSAADITLLTYLLVDKGIYVWEGKTYFLSTAHSEDDILFFQRSVEMSCLELASAGFFGSVTLDVHALNLLPMTEEQRRLYQVDSLSKERSSAFHEHFVIHLPLSTDLQVVRDTIEQVMHRHEILRVVKIDDTNMFVDNNVKVPFMKYSISQVEEAGWKTLVHEIVYEAFDFNQGPFFRVAVLKRTSGISIVFCIHHIISDGWSLATIRKELATIYDGIINSRPVLLPWPAQFSDFVRHNASGNVDRENEIADFWIDQFASDTDQFIPFAERQITSADARPAVISIDEKQLTAIRAISLQNKSTLFTTTLGIFKTWLDSVTGSKDHVIWVPFAGQMAMLEQDLVGQCVQMLPFRWMADRSRSWKDNISEVNTVVNQMYTNSQWSVESMTKRATDLGKEFFLPATEIAFNMDMKIHEDVVQSTDSISSKARYKLFANAVEVGKSMVITLEYDSALIPAEIMKEWMGNFSSILQTLITDISNEYHHYLSLGVTTVPRLYSDLRLSINDKTHDARPAIKHHDKKMSFAQLAKFSSLLSQYIASKYEREHKKGVAIVMDNYVLGLSAAWASIRLQIPFLFLHPADIQTANTKEYVVISQRDHFDKTASPYLVFLDDEKEAIMGMKGGGFVDHRLIRYLHSLSNGDDVILETSLSEWCGRMMPENIVPGEQLMIVTEGLKGSQVIDVMLAASLYGLETEIIDSSLSHTTNWVV
ncbi:MAG: aminotransferase class III-fold pyridoxal phosphate-dependent enzyme, partial [Cytophagales bacterium]|nr:aminotransferase class III-fold pyridoxal phosphate-dependent enzyme [Cytophagales bacterium]